MSTVQFQTTHSEYKSPEYVHALDARCVRSHWLFWQRGMNVCRISTDDAAVDAEMQSYESLPDRLLTIAAAALVRSA